MPGKASDDAVVVPTGAIRDLEVAQEVDAVLRNRRAELCPVEGIRGSRMPRVHEAASRTFRSGRIVQQRMSRLCRSLREMPVPALRLRAEDAHHRIEEGM